MLFLLKYSFIIIFLLISGSIYYFGFTEAGLQKEISLLSQFSNGKINIEKASGVLLSAFTLHNISYQTQHQQVAIRTLDFSWNPDGLLRGKFLINHIMIDHAKINIPKVIDKNSETQWNIDFFHRFIIKKIMIKTFTFQYADARIDADITLTDKWDAHWKIAIPHFKIVNPNSAGSLISSGTIQGEKLTPLINASIQANQFQFNQQKIEALTGKINLNLQPKTLSSIYLSANNIKINQHLIKKISTHLSGNMQYINKALLADIKMDILQKYKLTAQLALPHFTEITDLHQELMGKIQVTTSYLNWLVDCVPQIKNPQGILKSQIRLSGTLAKPTIALDATLTNGAMHIPQLGMSLERISLNAKTVALKTLIFNGQIFSGKGQGKLQGTVDLTKKDFPISLTFQGNQLPLVNLAAYKITASPNVSIIFVNHHLQLQGMVTVPYAEIAPKNFNSVITLPRDVVFVGQPKVSLPFLIRMQLAVHLGENIKINYNNLQAQLSGSLQIIQVPGSLPIGIGELYTTQGTYQAYGQKLSIQEGRLIFTGGQLINPGLNIRAVRTIKTLNVNNGVNSFSAMNNLSSVYTGSEILTVGVQAQGTVNNPIVTLISTPSGLSQNDILSYLLFGYPQSQISSRQTSTLLSAVSAVGLDGQSQFSSMTEKLQHSLGLTELNVESTDIFNPTSGSVVSTTSFVIGKQLGNNLSIHYSMGLFDPISILNLRYQLSKHFAVQSETSSIDNGADLLYEFERE